MCATKFLFILQAIGLACAAQTNVCFEGYVMDRFCIDRGTLLDNSQVKTLLHPELHSVHCLVDVSICYNSGFEILAPLSEATADAAYCPAYRIGGDSGFEKTLKLAREVGNKGAGCSTCTGDAVDKGFRAVFVGTASSGSTWSADKPPVLSVSEVLKAGSKCPNGLSPTQSPCGTPKTIGGADCTSTKGDTCLDEIRRCVDHWCNAKGKTSSEAVAQCDSENQNPNSPTGIRIKCGGCAISNKNDYTCGGSKSPETPGDDKSKPTTKPTATTSASKQGRCVPVSAA